MTFSIVHIVIALGLGIILGAVLLHFLATPSTSEQPFESPPPKPMYEGLDDLDDQTRLQVRPRIAMGQVPEHTEISDLIGISEEEITEDNLLSHSEMTLEEALIDDETLPFEGKWEKKPNAKTDL